MFLPTRILRLLAAFAIACALLAPTPARADKPDLERLYANLVDDPAQPPVVLIHGLMGSTLVDARTGKQFWPGSLGSLAFGNYARLGVADDAALVPGELVTDLAGVVDYYGELLRVLETVAHFKRGVPGTAVPADDRRRYYVYLYDWRRDNVEAARGLHDLIEMIRADYGDPALRVDLIAHSNGGLIANYYLRYGARDVLADTPPVPTFEGAARVRRVLMLGTPNLGSVTSLYRLQHGVRVGLRTVPVEVLATFATPFQALPPAEVQAIVDPHGQPVALDLYDPETWRRRQWSVYSPEVIQRVRDSASEPGEADHAVRGLQATFERHLVRAGRFQRALAVPFSDPAVEVALFGGDCTLTLARAVFVREPGGDRLAFAPREVLPPGSDLELTDATRKRLDRLLFEPGDGLVTRASQVGRDRPLAPHAPGARPAPLFPLAQSFFLCEGHGQLTANAYFQNNLLNYLLAR
jgi:pimeloyl-ACP methyl ester carboxylesterase